MVSDLMMPSGQEGLPMEHGNSVMDMDIAIISAGHDCIDIHINNIDTVWPIIAMAVINLGRGQRYPGDLVLG